MVGRKYNWKSVFLFNIHNKIIHKWFRMVGSKYSACFTSTIIALFNSNV